MGLAPSNIRFSNISPTSLTISCTPGNGSGRVFLLKATDSILAFPQNGTSYFGDPVFGYGNQLPDGSFVIADTGTQVNVSNLTPGTLYYARIFEYSGSGIYTDYDQAVYLADTVRTAVPSSSDSTTDSVSISPSVGASGIDFSNITTSSVRVNCTAGNGQARIFVIRASDSVTNLPVSGLAYVPDTIFGKGSDLGNYTYVVADTGTTVVITGLAPATIYYVAVFEVNGNGSSSIYMTHPFPTQSFTTDGLGTTTVVNWQDSSIVVNVFPNPVQEDCFIQVQSNMATTMAVGAFDIAGRRVGSYSMAVALGLNNFELKDFGKLSKGLYVLSLQIGGHKAVFEVFKE